MSNFPYALKEITKQKRKETNKRYCHSLPLLNLTFSENSLKLNFVHCEVFLSRLCEVNIKAVVSDLKQITLSPGLPILLSPSNLRQELGIPENKKKSQPHTCYKQEVKLRVSVPLEV